MIVQKFGGSSRRKCSGFKASAELIGKYAADEQLVVVLSAVHGVTDLMIGAIDHAIRGESYAKGLDEIQRREQARSPGLPSSSAPPQAGRVTHSGPMHSTLLT